MPPPLIVFSPSAPTAEGVLGTHVVRESKSASLHLKSLDEFVPKDLPEIIGKTHEVRLLVG
jgi:hypothetical protein